MAPRRQGPLLRAGGGAAVQITKGKFEAWRPQWSPDSKRIVFDANEPDKYGDRHLYVASFGDEAAQKLDVDPARLFKTLVVSVEGALAVAMVPVTGQLDLKALGKRAKLADKGQAQAATGYVTGGTSPLGQRKRLPAHLDASALEHQTILVNGGRRGLRPGVSLTQVWRSVPGSSSARPSAPASARHG